MIRSLTASCPPAGTLELVEHLLNGPAYDRWAANDHLLSTPKGPEVEWIPMIRNRLCLFGLRYHTTDSRGSYRPLSSPSTQPPRIPPLFNDVWMMSQCSFTSKAVCQNIPHLPPHLRDCLVPIYGHLYSCHPTLCFARSTERAGASLSFYATSGRRCVHIQLSSQPMALAHSLEV